jgi:hypothetical protein
VTDEQQQPGEPGAVQGYDAEVVAALARGQDPGLPEELARELAVLAGEHLGGMERSDAPELARRLLADVPRVGATPAAVVARAAVQFCREHGLGPG